MASKTTSRCAAFSALVAIAAALGMGSSAASPPIVLPTVIQEVPYTVWDAGAEGLDAVGSWLKVDPLVPAGAAFLPPYVHVHTFSFQGRAPGGSIALGYIGESKVVGFGTFDAAGNPQQLTMPYEWHEGANYFPLVYQPVPGVVAAAVHEAETNSWTHVGSFAVPAEWGRLSSVSVTWSGSYAKRPACADFPVQSAQRLSPVGIVGDAVLVASAAIASGKVAGDCIAQSTVLGDPPARALYLLGVP